MRSLRPGGADRLAERSKVHFNVSRHFGSKNHSNSEFLALRGKRKCGNKKNSGVIFVNIFKI